MFRCISLDALIRPTQCSFYHVYRADKHLHMSHLLQVTRLQPAIDVDYLAFSARRSAEAEGSGSGNAQSGMTRVAFEKHLADARTCTLKAAQAQVSLTVWLCLTTAIGPRSHCYGRCLAAHLWS